MIWAVAALVVLLLLALAGWGTVTAMSSRRAYRLANQIVPGVSTAAPAAWAGAHSPEALLHRRLRDSMRALQHNPRRDDASFLDVRVGLEQQALDVDERLMGVAALPEHVRAEPLAAVAVAVEAVEQAVVALATRMSAETPMLEQSTAELTERFRYIEQARAELDRLRPATAPDSLASDNPAERKREDPQAASDS